MCFLLTPLALCYCSNPDFCLSAVLNLFVPFFFLQLAVESKSMNTQPAAVYSDQPASAQRLVVGSRGTAR